jgi:ketosteroid isomerase-like protein
MESKASLELIEELQEAAHDQDFDRYGALLADDVSYRMAGVPAAMGGVTTGRQAIVDQFKQNAGVSRFEIKRMFGDGENVCVVGKVTAERFTGNGFLRPAELPFSTYECVVYRIADGKVAESTAYVNWLDPYVQVGLVDASSLTP